MPTLRAADWPLLIWWSRVTRPSRWAMSRTMSRVASTEPSLTHTTSTWSSVWPSTLSTVWAMYSSTLYMGMITDTLGASTRLSTTTWAGNTWDRLGRVE